VTTFLAELPGLDTLPRDNILRQSLSLYAITYIGESDLLSAFLGPQLSCVPIGILLLYFGVATGAYFFIFDHRSEFLFSLTRSTVANALLLQ
jgi:Delta7-sterol 5-desaturase